DAAMRGPDAINAIRHGRNADGAPGVAAQGEVGGPAGNGRGRSAGGSSWQAIGRARIDGGAIVRVRTQNTVEEFVANGLAGDGRASVQDAGYRVCVGCRGIAIRQPGGIAGACHLADNVEHVFHNTGQPLQRPRRCPLYRRSQIVWNERAAFFHAPVPAESTVSDTVLSQGDTAWFRKRVRIRQTTYSGERR